MPTLRCWGEVLAAAATVGALGSGCGRIGFDDSGAVDLDFTLDAFPSMLAFSRATPATFVDAAGRIETAPVDAPRFDHDPVTGAPLGLLIEPAGANLAVFSEQLDAGSSWFTNGTATIAPDVALAPDGSLTADRFVDQDTSSQCRRATGVDIPDDSQEYTFSIFVKSETLTSFSFSGELLSGSQLVQPVINVDLTTGEIVSSGPGKYTAAGVIPLRDGWFRVWLALANNATGNTSALLSLWSDRTNAAATGSLLAWGAQIEVGGGPTSYLQTLASPASRAPDMATAPSAAWFRPDAGTVRLAGRVGGTAGPQRTGFYADGGAAGAMRVVRSVTDGAVALEIVTGAAAPTRLVGTAWPEGEPHTVAWSYSAADVAFSDSGSAPLTADSAALPAAYDALYFGTDPSGSGALGGDLARFRFTPGEDSDGELETASQ